MGKIEIIGTSHIAQQSVNELRRKIRFEKPDIVAVELDIARLQDLMSGGKHRKPKLKDIPKIGLFGWIFAVLGSLVQKRLGKKVGAEPGSDMKAAVVSAREIGSQVVLIDRPIGETIRGMSKKVPMSEKLKLLWFLLFGWIFDPKGVEKLNKFNLKKVPSQKVIHDIIYEFRHKFPSIYKVLVTERDEYMSRRIKFIMKKFPEDTILVVVGAGHIDGMKRLLGDSNK